jgi:hydroxymethylpyrimidine pyrophosphatase-like HAD family hydrolase
VAIRCVYTDLDGTLLGKDGSLVHDADGLWTDLPMRALQMCERVGAEVVMKSGRRKASVMAAARLLGQRSFICEVGCGLVVDGEEEFLTDGLVPQNGKTIFELIDESGAPVLLLSHYAGRLEYHAPWHRNRDISHVLRGSIDAAEANELLRDHGHDQLRLVDNGVIGERTSSTLAAAEGPLHAYHLMPRGGSKLRAVARHMQMRGYRPEECIAVGDSREDLEVAEVVGRFFLVANAVENDPSIREAIRGRAHVEITEGRNGEGFYEAVVRSLAESR